MFSSNGHLLDCESFNKTNILEFFNRVWEIKNICSTINGRRNFVRKFEYLSATLFFTQSSTRTFFSFMRACQFLGMQTLDFRDASTSSLSKGESIDDTLHTLSNYSDLIIIRSLESDLVENLSNNLIKWDLATKIINAGSGMKSHPTQALLDVYTLWDIYWRKPQTNLKGLTVAVVGDLLRGRAVNSFVRTLSLFENTSFVFVAPPKFQLSDDLKKILDNKNISYTTTDNLDSCVTSVDVVYMTRMQDEYSDGKDSAALFTLNHSLVQKLPAHASILHPLPRREEIPAEIDVDPRAKYWQQELNGLWCRIALIDRQFG